MYFKKLELYGFKSFAEKTTLHFEPGITAVVGPNGCGKSNIFDSIRWVLGEQSVKSLRGSKMEDVIFNGTENIPPLGYTEVSLTFSNETKVLPIEYSEVTIARRLFRSGESEYLINKTPVRLKDILQLFMGTGIGAESYSLIEQGKIDLILSSRPEDRRLIFDEAAGISKYKSQKKETIRRLEDTEANLLRINDIIVEVKRQIGSLERQAAKARRYKEVFEKLKVLEGEMASFQLKQYRNETDGLSQELKQLTDQETQTLQSTEQLGKESGDKENELSQLEAKLDLLKQEASAKDISIEHNNQQLLFNRERINELKGRIEALEGQKKELLIKLSRDEEKINNFKSGLDILNKELEEKRQLANQSNLELKEVTSGITLAQNNIVDAKAKILNFAAVEASQNNQIQDLTSQLHQTLARKKRLDIEKVKTEEELSQAKEKLGSANSSLEAALKAFSAQKRQNEELKLKYDNACKEKERLRDELSRLENEKAGLESQKEFLTSLKLKYENITESSEAILLLDSLADRNISGIILKVKEIRDANARDSEASGKAKIKIAGTAKPLSLDPQEAIAKIEQLVNQIEEQNASLKLAIDSSTELSQRLSESDRLVRESEIEYNKLNTLRENAQEYYKKLSDESELVLSESRDTINELAKLKENESLLSESLSKVKLEAQNNQQAIERWLEDIAKNNSRKEKVLVAIAQLETEITSYEEKVKNSHQTYQIYEESYLGNQAALKSCQEEEISSAKRIRELEESMVNLNTEIDSAVKRKLILEEGINSITDSLANIKNQLKDLQLKIEDFKKSLDDNRKRKHELEMRIQELSFSQNSIQERISQVYKISAEELNSFFKPELDLSAAGYQIEELKAKLDSYGQVNLVAIDEFEELKKRYDFLILQHEDLTKSKESLHEAILKINRTTKKMFLETFEKLAVEFKNYFRLLFGGGDAQLFLIDEQDVLESGIEIICRPPGKKLQNVLLLSGGEKAMSAIALLFAIFKVRPSPFCVLDEIDAALDEANVDRFSRTLLEFTKQSQFIVITHNKKTIVNANIMYGITMEKAGISKIVSVKLAENKDHLAGNKEQEGNTDNVSGAPSGPAAYGGEAEAHLPKQKYP